MKATLERLKKRGVCFYYDSIAELGMTDEFAFFLCDIYGTDPYGINRNLPKGTIALFPFPIHRNNFKINLNLFALYKFIYDYGFKPDFKNEADLEAFELQKMLVRGCYDDVHEGTIFHWVIPRQKDKKIRYALCDSED